MGLDEGIYDAKTKELVEETSNFLNALDFPMFCLIHKGNDIWKSMVDNSPYWLSLLTENPETYFFGHSHPPKLGFPVQAPSSEHKIFSIILFPTNYEFITA